MSLIQKLLGLLLLYRLLSCPVSAKTHHHKFVITEANYTRLCQTKSIMTVNGQFPGPTIYARKGDTIIVNVVNHVESNITIHWHGVHQPRNPWYDGPEYITQCPIRPGHEFSYDILLSDEEGTIWWHAHSNWDRATVHGAIFVYPKLGSSFPFAIPYKEIPIILGEWWNDDVNKVLNYALYTRGDSNASDAYTINGQPGDLYPCSKPGTFTAQVEYGKTYLLRVVSAAINNELFFAVAQHQLTVVGSDGSYTKPFNTNVIMISPGQTMDLLLVANQKLNTSSSGNRYYMAASLYGDAPGVKYDNTTTTAILEYVNPGSNKTFVDSTPTLPSLPTNNDTDAVTTFVTQLRSLASKEHPVDVPQTINERLIISVSVNVLPCDVNYTCLGPYNMSISASLNNISFQDPTTTPILDAYYHQIPGVFEEGFPSRPPFSYNFTHDDLPRYLMIPKTGTEVRMVEYNTSIELVFQGTSILAIENHPMHLHGQNVYVVGTGFGNFDEKKDPEGYNLVDPPFLNTVGVPKVGWTAIRFKAKNPGVWFMHCHVDRHQSWGMNTVFIVKNGATPESKILPPPKDMPQC
ncbi:Laccase protein [Dioscorea alata]|uniref:Laccase protein n=1 Tax=Dioscorea alata TaxID=55571 RepID=A0ACB7VRR3_DIOAL|nr:Laccase protein [Dioscorea alata]